MRITTLLKALIFVYLANGCLLESVTPSDYQMVKVPTFQLDLDLPSIKRWNMIPQSYCQILRDFEQPYTSYIKKKRFQDNESTFQEFLKVGINYLITSAPKEFFEEMQSIHNHCGLTLEYLLIYNYVYEMERLGCTSILTKQENGSVNLTSNLDYFFFEYYSRLVIKVEFMKGGVKAFEGSVLFGSIGFTRGQK